VTGEGELWKCSRCGAKLVARNLSHACGRYTVAQFLHGRSKTGRALFKRFVALIAACGPYDVAPAKTRVAFMAQVRFATVNKIGEDAIDVHLVLPRVLDSPRFRRVERVGNVHVHHLRLCAPAQLDRELAGWIRSAYVEYGQRTWLRSPRTRLR
jgi:hypothetical protein